jgi:tetratricopeptide (TPR) repeat protein
MPPRLLVQQLTDRLDVLADGIRDLPPRQQSLLATLEWSYELLTPRQRRVYADLAVFRGGCTLAAAAFVCAGDLADIVRDVAALLDSSLLLRRPAAGGDFRFGMLETVAQHAQHVLLTSDRNAAVRRRHAEWCAQLTATMEPSDQPSDRSSAVAALDAEQDNLRACLRWLIAAGEVELGLRVACQLEWYWDWRSRLHEGWETLDALLARATAACPLPRDLEARARGAAARIAYRLADYDRARALWQESLDLAGLIGDERQRAWALHGLALISRDQTDDADFARQNDRSLVIFEALGERRGIASALHHRAIAAIYRKQAAAARPPAEQALQLYRELRDERFVASVQATLGATAEELGDAGLASSLMQEALAIRRHIGDELGVAAALSNLGLLAHKAGDFQLATSRLEEALKLNERLGHRRGVALALQNLGRTTHAMARWPAAREYHSRSLSIWHDLGDRRSEAWVTRNLARTLLAAGEPDRGCELALESLDMFRALEDRGGEAAAQELLSDVDLAAGRTRDGVAGLEAAARLYEASGRRLDAARCRRRAAGLMGEAHYITGGTEQ